MLTRLAGEVGLNEKEFEEALRTRKYREAHRRALRHAYEEAGVTGVPMFVIGQQVLTGLQSGKAVKAKKSSPDGSRHRRYGSTARTWHGRQCGQTTFD